MVVTCNKDEKNKTEGTTAWWNKLRGFLMGETVSARLVVVSE